MLRGLGVRDERVFAEAFGPAALVRSGEGGEAVGKLEDEAELAVVRFAKSNVE